MELFSRSDDRAFGSMEHVLQKWICLPEITDAALHVTLEERLKLLYYDWLVTKLYRFRYMEAFEISRKITATGESNKMIYRTIASRAKKKMSTLVNQFHRR